MENEKVDLKANKDTTAALGDMKLALI